VLLLADCTAWHIAGTRLRPGQQLTKKMHKHLFEKGSVDPSDPTAQHLWWLGTQPSRSPGGFAIKNLCHSKSSKYPFFKLQSHVA
jgi:hypothetical protein